jgi:hypothetical protein
LRAVQWSDVPLGIRGPGGLLGRGISALSYIQVDGAGAPVPAFFASWLYSETIREALGRELRVAGWNGSEHGVTHDLTSDDEKVLGAQLLLLASFWLFVRQKILVTRGMTPARQARKRIQRADWWQARPLVRVVELRRREAVHEHAAQGNDDEHDWSCQWVVRGHWRQQFYPSTRARQPVWITPYVKGPENKPLKPPRATVFAVVR